MPDDNVYRSRMGIGYACCPLFFIVVGICLLSVELSTVSVASAIAFCATGLFFIFICLRTRYIFGENGLTIKTLFTEREIKYSSINWIKDESLGAVHQMVVPYSSEMVHMQYDRNGHVWVTPVRKQEFISKLRARCPLVR